MEKVELETTMGNSKGQMEETVEMFIGGLPQDSEEGDLLQLLSPYIRIVNLVLNRRKRSSKCLGHGTLTIPKSELSKISAIDHILYKGRKVKILKKMKGEELKKHQREFSKRRLYLKNLPSTVKTDELKSIFVSFGKLESCYIRGEPLTETKIGIVIFCQKESARMAYSAYRFGKILELKKYSFLKIGFIYSEMIKTDKKETEKNLSFKKDQLRISKFLKQFLTRPGKIGYKYNLLKEDLGDKFHLRVSQRPKKFNCYHHFAHHRSGF